ncbi:MAG: hypothetical protein P4M08_00965 [Oligoflexia bacterium]|nr:hypothetical protein [Oligoflexia bacterium]
MCNMNLKAFFGMLVGIMLISTSCTIKNDTGNDPKKVLQEYISRSFAVKSPSERQDLLTLLTSEAKSRLSAWSDDQFREAFIDSKREFVKLAFTEAKSVSPRETSVTYELSYIDHGKGHDAKVTQKKLAQMVQEQGKWLIADVKNIKELVEYKDEMTLP